MATEVMDGAISSDGRVFGSYLRNYREHRAMPAGMKWCAVSVLWLTIGLSIVAIDHLPVRAMLVVVAVGVTILIARIRTLDRRSGDPVSPS